MKALNSTVAFFVFCVLSLRGALYARNTRANASFVLEEEGEKLAFMPRRQPGERESEPSFVRLHLILFSFSFLSPLLASRYDKGTPS